MMITMGGDNEMARAYNVRRYTLDNWLAVDTSRQSNAQCKSDIDWLR